MDYDPKTVVWDKQRQSKEHRGNARVLVVGPTNPSTGGIPSYINDLLSSTLREEFNLGLLDPLIIKMRIKKQESHLSLKELKGGLMVLKIFVEAIRSFDPALVHIHTSSYWGFYEKAVLLAIAKIIFKKRVILHIHGGEFDIFYQKALCKWLIDWITLWADKTLIVSKEIKERLGFVNMMHVDNCVAFNDGMFSIKKEEVRKNYAIPKDKTVFLSLALLQERKGLIDTLEVFKIIVGDRNDFLFIIAGEGPERERIIKFVQDNRLSENVRIYDYISGQKKDDILLLSDVFISNSMVESFGISLIEAVSHGLFVITTPVGIASNAERVFNNGNCIIIPLKSSEALQQAILKILNKDIDLEKITTKNYFDFKIRFDVDPVFDKMRGIYEEVLAG